ncbi:MAG: hypothetical protein V7672_06360 [Brevundimonas sp.]|jgi:ethanolamine ammonia-lyase small subunit
MGRPPIGSTAVMVKVPPALMAAVDRFIVEERPGISRPEALRILAAEALAGMGLLDPDA